MERFSFRVAFLGATLSFVLVSAELAASGPLGRFRERRNSSSDSSPSTSTNPLRDPGLPSVPAAEQASEPLRSASPDVAQDERQVADAARQNDELGTTQPDENQAVTSSNDDEDLSSELLEFRAKLRACLRYYYDRPENAASRSPWGIMHSFIAFGVDTMVTASDRKITAIGYLCWNGAGRGQRLFYVSDGKLQPRVGSGYQGHEGQFLAMLAQSRVRTSHPMRVGGHEFTVEDLIEYEKLTCRPNTELTFKLIALAHYLPSDAEWQDDQGRPWTIEELIKEELAQPIIGATCGGTHRLMGLSYAVRAREKRGEAMTGQWLRAKKYLDEFHDYTFKLQNADGSFSTDWFESRGDWGNRDRRLRTTGHILEWLVYSLPKEQLKEPRVLKAVDYLMTLLWENRDHAWEIGPKGHGLRALALYDQRVFGAKPGQGGPQVDSTQEIVRFRLVPACGPSGQRSVSVTRYTPAGR